MSEIAEDFIPENMRPAKPQAGAVAEFAPKQIPDPRARWIAPLVAVGLGLCVVVGSLWFRGGYFEAVSRGAMGTVLLCIGLAVLIAVGFCPAFLAFSRRHPNRVAITALNVLLGWTFVGWVVALVWSLTAIDSGRAARAGRC